MKRQVPGLAETARDARPEIPDGIFLVRVDGAQFRWHAHKPFYVLRLSILEPRTLTGQPIVGRLYCTQKAMWKLGWFLRDFLYDPELLAHEQVDEKALPGLRGIVSISHTVINGISLDQPRRLRPRQPVGRIVHSPSNECSSLQHRGGYPMTYSYTQISQYLSCPRRYRHRYLDGWQEKDTRAAMLFGRAFEQAVAALFRREDPAAVLFAQWGLCKDIGLTYSGNDTWDRMLQQGIQLLERFAQDGRVRIRRPRSTQQIQFNRTLSSGNTFVSYIDAIGELDGTTCVLEWKTAAARFPEEPAGISALDPQLVCYSWMTGIEEVAQIVFVRKRLVEIQYLRATISDEQRWEFATLVEDTVRRIESGLFLPHSGIRFPQNPCTTCPFIGLCLDKPDLVEAGLVRKPGVDLGLFDELLY
jgi:hypothetical protein